MRNLLCRAAGLALVGALFSTQAMAADATATASIGATVVQPIAITKTADLNFGNFAADDATSGTVVISTAGARSFTGGATGVSAGTGTVSAASFTVTGEGTSTFSITLPSSAVTLTHATDATKTMSVSTFTSNPSATGALTAGSATVTVGATLSVAAAQTTGVYSNSTGLPVTVAYN